MTLTKVWLYHPLDVKGGVYSMYSAATLLPMPQQLPVLAPAALLILAGAGEEETLITSFVSIFITAYRS